MQIARDKSPGPVHPSFQALFFLKLFRPQVVPGPCKIKRAEFRCLPSSQGYLEAFFNLYCNQVDIINDEMSTCVSN